jgi:hypothetical protein
LKKKNRNEHLDVVSDALFGSSIDLGAREAAEDLSSAGIDPIEVQARMYERLCALAREYRLRDKPVPPRLDKCIEALRKKVGPPRGREEMNDRAELAISEILTSVRSMLHPVIANVEFAEAFRNKTAQQSVADRQIIEKLKKQLADDLRKNDKRNDV